MTRTLLWIGGWASPFAVWEPELTSLAPGARHEFLDAHGVLEGDGVLRQELSGLDPGSCVVAWSLGSLLALEMAAAGNWPQGVRLLAVCPVLDFCGSGGPWRPLVLDRMIRALEKDPAGTLSSFRERMWPGMPERLASRWLEGALAIPMASLVRGLEALRDRRVDAAALEATGTVWVLGGRDAVSPALAGFRGEVHRLDTGHVPFLEDPEGFGQILSVAEGHLHGHGGLDPGGAGEQ